MLHRVLLAIALVWLGLLPSAQAQSKLQLTVFTGKGVSGYDVNSTLISGDKEMLLIDAQFSLSSAHRLAAEILESGKQLTTIYVTHSHPDHLFGLAVVKQAFPQARIVALPQAAAAVATAGRRGRSSGRRPTATTSRAPSRWCRRR